MWARQLIAVIAAVNCLQTTGVGQSFSVSAEIVEGCTVNQSAQTTGVNFGTLAFGSYPAVHTGPVLGSVTLGAATVQLECTANLALQVSVGPGLHANGVTRRLGHNGGNTYLVDYALYTNVARTSAVPLTGSVGVTMPASGVMELPIYGVATLPGTGLMPGIYNDTLQVTLAW